MRASGGELRWGLRRKAVLGLMLLVLLSPRPLAGAHESRTWQPVLADVQLASGDGGVQEDPADDHTVAFAVKLWPGQAVDCNQALEGTERLLWYALDNEPLERVPLEMMPIMSLM